MHWPWFCRSCIDLVHALNNRNSIRICWKMLAFFTFSLLFVVWWFKSTVLLPFSMIFLLKQKPNCVFCINSLTNCGISFSTKFNSFVSKTNSINCSELHFLAFLEHWTYWKTLKWLPNKKHSLTLPTIAVSRSMYTILFSLLWATIRTSLFTLLFLFLCLFLARCERSLRYYPSIYNLFTTNQHITFEMECILKFKKFVLFFLCVVYFFSRLNQESFNCVWNNLVLWSWLTLPTR